MGTGCGRAVRAPQRLPLTQEPQVGPPPAAWGPGGTVPAQCREVIGHRLVGLIVITGLSAR